MRLVYKVMCLLVLFVITALTGCSGGGSGPGAGAGASPAAANTVTGVAATGAALRGTVYLSDSSLASKKIQTATSSEGSFTFNVSGMTAPFLLKAEDSSDPTRKYYSIATASGLTNVTPLTTVIVADATGSSNLDTFFEQYRPNDLMLSAEKMPASAKKLQTALSGLLALNNAQNIDMVNGLFQANHTGIDAVMDSVKIVLSNGTITISNNNTPSVPLFTAQLGSIAQGKLDLTLLPSTPAPQSTGSALYTSKCAGCHGAIATTNLKNRATLALTKGAITSNRGGMFMLAGLSDADIQGIIDSFAATSSSPVPTPSPIAVPTPAQAVDGSALYAANCAECHGQLGTSRKTGATIVRLQNAISGDVGGMSYLASLSSNEIDAIVLVLNPAGATPVTVPPAPGPVPAPAPANDPIPTTAPAVDGAAAYSTACAACHRPLTTSTKTGITSLRLDSAITNNVGGMGFLSTITTAIKDAIVAALAPVLPSPSPVPTPSPTPSPTPTPALIDGATLYSANCAGCHGAIANSSKRGISLARLDGALAGNVGGMGYLSGLSAPERQAIVDALVATAPLPTPIPVPAPIPTPVPTPIPVPTPADGAALYGTNCAGCHGSLATSSKTGITISRLQNAINSNVAGMGSLSRLTVSEVQAIVTVLTPTTPTPSPTPGPAPTPTPTPAPVPTPVDGASLYTSHCAGCHGALAVSAKAGVTVIRIQNAISGNSGGMGYLSTLTVNDISAIAAALPAAAPAPTPTPTPVDGPTLYGSKCAGCHGALASSAKAGASVTAIQNAINGNIGGMGSLSTLASSDVSAISSALATVTPSPVPSPVCGSCHAIPPATARHSTHKSQNISCAVCHGSGYSTTTVNAATHNNGVKNIDVARTGWNVVVRTCSNSCHGTETWR